MAYINNILVFVEEEEVTRGVEVSKHPVEQGLNITDNIKRDPITIQLSGEIVGEKAPLFLKMLTLWHQTGSYVKYIGRNIISNAVITSFDTGHTIDIKGGCSFRMSIEEIRVTKPAYIPTKNVNSNSKKSTKSGTQQVKKNTKETWHTVKSGDTLWGIAAKYYGNGSQYNKIYKANTKLIKDPNKISIGWKLLIP